MNNILSCMKKFKIFLVNKYFERNIFIHGIYAFYTTDYLYACITTYQLTCEKIIQDLVISTI